MGDRLNYRMQDNGMQVDDIDHTQCAVCDVPYKVRIETCAIGECVRALELSAQYSLDAGRLGD